MKWHIPNTASGLVVKEKKNTLDVNAIVPFFYVVFSQLMHVENIRFR